MLLSACNGRKVTYKLCVKYAWLLLKIDMWRYWFIFRWSYCSYSIIRRGAFTCVGWQVTRCDPIWQVTSRSSEMGFPWRGISAFISPFLSSYCPRSMTPSVCLCLWLNNTSYFKSEQVNRKCSPRNTVLQLLTPTPNLSPQALHLLNQWLGAIWWINWNHTVNNRKPHYLHIWNALLGSDRRSVNRRQNW